MEYLISTNKLGFGIPVISAMTGGIKRRIAVQASLGKNARSYQKITTAKRAGVWLEW
jgi:hypothetical protein